MNSELSRTFSRERAAEAKGVSGNVWRFQSRSDKLPLTIALARNRMRRKNIFQLYSIHSLCRNHKVARCIQHHPAGSFQPPWPSRPLDLVTSSNSHDIGFGISQRQQQTDNMPQRLENVLYYLLSFQTQRWREAVCGAVSMIRCNENSWRWMR